MMTDLDMQEVIRTKHPDLPQVTTFKWGSCTGSSQIDGMFATSDISIKAGAWMAFHKFIGDHHAAMIDIPWKILLGKDILKIVRPQACRLSCNLPKAKQEHEDKFMEQARNHELLSKLQAVHRWEMVPYQRNKRQRWKRLIVFGKN